MVGINFAMQFEHVQRCGDTTTTDLFGLCGLFSDFAALATSTFSPSSISASGSAAAAAAAAAVAPLVAPLASAPFTPATALAPAVTTIPAASDDPPSATLAADATATLTPRPNNLLLQRVHRNAHVRFGRHLRRRRPGRRVPGLPVRHRLRGLRPARAAGSAAAARAAPAPVAPVASAATEASGEAALPTQCGALQRPVHRIPFIRLGWLLRRRRPRRRVPRLPVRHRLRGLRPPPHKAAPASPSAPAPSIASAASVATSEAALPTQCGALRRDVLLRLGWRLRRRWPRLQVPECLLRVRLRLRRLRSAPREAAPASPVAARAAITRAPGTPGRRHHLFGHMRSVSAFLWRHVLRVERHLRGRWGGLLRCLVHARY